MNLEVAVKDLRDQLTAIQRRLDRIEGSMIFLHTTQVQKVGAVSDTASAAEVRTAAQQLANALRTLGIGA